MQNRCGNPNYKGYHRYGGRGIAVRFKDFGAFRSWACQELKRIGGWRSGLSIDRIDNDGDYEAGNVRFLSIAENSARARRGVGKLSESSVLSIRKDKAPYSEIAAKHGISIAAVHKVKKRLIWSHV